MGLFSNRPHRGIEAELIDHGNKAMGWFDYVLRTRKTRTPGGAEDSALDLTAKESRDAIREELVRLIWRHGLAGCTENEINSVRLVDVARQDSRPPVLDAALVTALAMNSVNLIARIQKEEYPRYRPLSEMLDELSRTCCAGAAQTLGDELPPEVIDTWPYFARMFDEVKHDEAVRWPDV